MAGAMPMMYVNEENAVAVELAMHEKLVEIVVNVQHLKLVVVAHVLATSCPIVRPRTYSTYSDPG